MVVPLLFLARTCRQTQGRRLLEDREKASIKTPMIARQGNDILVVTDLDKVLYDDAVNRGAPHSQAGVSTSGKNRPLCFFHDCW